MLMIISKTISRNDKVTPAVSAAEVYHPHPFLLPLTSDLKTQTGRERTNIDRYGVGKQT